MTTELHLPKGYLSYSAWNLWKRDKAAYRARYYEGEPYMSTVYTDFGNLVGEYLETGDFEEAAIMVPGGEILQEIPRYSHPEHKLEVDILGVPFLMYLDSFNEGSNSLLEYKTGIRNKADKVPWDAQKVRKHTQLPVYALGIKTAYGSYDPLVKLVWMETKWSTIDYKRELGTKVFSERAVGLKLTGEYEVFEREIRDWELDRIAQIIREDAEAISEDYKSWKTLKEKGIPF